MATLIVGAGCFWGVEEAFRQLPGVESTRVGYAGGWAVAPTYEDVCAGHTGHAEVVEVIYDPELVSLAQLLDLFWSLHAPDPANSGQYRSLILCPAPEQVQLARQHRDRLASAAGQPLSTDIGLAGAFYEAETYHQQFYKKRRHG